jgi:pimeloyl-ACP methyl ester carboxylesterase
MSPLSVALIVVAIVLGLIVLIALGSARSIVYPARAALWTDPKKEAGLDFEEVSFDAPDGVRISGWFLPAATTGGPGPVAIVVHGWLWNRLGTRSSNPINDFPGGKPVMLMPLAARLVREGYHVLLFDLRNHGRSARRGVYTGGWLEARDLLGAVGAVAARPEVDAARIGVVGFSVGGNILLQALPLTTRIRAGVAVQPADVHGFMTRFNRQYFGPFGPPIKWLTEKFYGLGGGPTLADLHPMYAAPGAGDVPILFVQGTGDRWGGVPDVERMIERTPNPVTPIFPETGHRFDGYNWVVEHPDVVVDFFAAHLGSAGRSVPAA